MAKIYEDRYDQEMAKVITEVNTDEQIKRGDYYKKQYYIRYGEIQGKLEQWKELEALYACERDYIENAPNSFIPVINPIISGQVAALVEKNVQANVMGRGVSDVNFAHTVQILIDLMLKECNIKQLIKEIAKNYLLFGFAWVCIDYDPDTFRGGTGNNIGFPRFRVPEGSRIIIDGKIKNLRYYQQAEYIMEEIGFKSIDWVRRNFGDDMADSVIRLNHVYPFDGDVSYDDINATSLLYVWTKNNKHGNLQRIVMDKRGLILDESDPKTPYYDFVNNEYPFGICGLYKQEGKFYRFGDGLLLKPLQETINNLFDELVTACKFSAQPRTFIDPKAQCDPDQFDNDPSHPITALDPRANIFIEPAVGINPVVERLVNILMQEAQKATRFSALMAGNMPEERMTATQAGIQVQQGNNTINDKRMDISDMLSFCLKYGIGLIMEFWTAAQALRVTEDAEHFDWVDPRQLANIPVMVPADSKFRKMWKEKNPESPESEIPKWMQLELKDDSGELELATKSIDFDLSVTIGEGMPTSKIAVYNLLLSLAQISLVDEVTGMPRPLIGLNKFKNMAQDLLGINLEDEETEQMMQQQAMQQNMQADMQANMQGNQRPVNISPDIPGANMNGTPIGGDMG